MKFVVNNHGSSKFKSTVVRVEVFSSSSDGESANCVCTSHVRARCAIAGRQAVSSPQPQPPNTIHDTLYPHRNEDGRQQDYRICYARLK
jgi:hypothetical protein